MPQVKNARATARGIVISGKSVVLIERWRKDDAGSQLHYFSIPGGKIEPGETPEAAVKRELFEETSLNVAPSRIVAKQYLKNGSSNVYYMCDFLSGKIELHQTATEVQSDANRSLPCWVTADKLKSLPLNMVYEPLRQLIADVLKGRLPDKPMIIK